MRRGTRAGRAFVTLAAIAVTAVTVCVAVVSAAAPTTDDHADVPVAAAPEPEMDVEVEVADTLGQVTLVAAIVGAGGTITGDVPGALLQARIPVDAFDALANDPAGSGLRRPRSVGVAPNDAPAVGLAATSAHLDTTGASAWHAAGITGAGVRVGIIDYFDAGTWSTTLGTFPAPTHRRCLDTSVDCDSRYFTGMSGGVHGVAVAESLLGMAPGVELFIGTAHTTADTKALVDWFAANGVGIVVRSLADVYDGPGDGRGPLAAVVDHATSKGIVWVNSAGNQGVDRYYRGRSLDSNNNGVIEFGPGADEFLRIDGCVLLGGLRWHTDWDLPPVQRQDYDLYVYTAPTTDGIPSVDLNSPVFVSDLDQRGSFGPAQVPLEGVGARLGCPPIGHSHYVRVERFAGTRDDNDVLELLVFPIIGDVSIEHVSATEPAAFSATLPVVDSRSRALVSVGATPTPTSTTVAPFSNRGPTNDGRTKPEMVAPSCLASALYSPCFSGTSASAPLAGGAAALLVGAGLATNGRQLAAALKHRTVDLAPTGPDQASGWGLLRLGPVPAPGVDPSPSAYTPLGAPRRVLDTRPATAVGPPGLIGRMEPDEIRTLQVTGVVGVPDTGVTAVAVNVTTESPSELGYLQVLPSQVQGSAVGGFSTLNIDTVGRTVANFSIVPVGPSGAIDLYAASGGHLIIDVLGWFGPSDATASGRLVGVEPVRVLDTRPGSLQQIPAGWNPARVPTSGDSIRLPAAPAAVVPADATVRALVVNVTGTDATSTAVVQAFPTGAPGVIGTTSTLNLTPGRAVANTVIVPVGADGSASLYVEVVGGGRVHLVADVTGYITSDAAAVSTAGRFVPVAPGRVLDTRAAGGTFTSNEIRTQPITQVGGPRPPVPAGASAAMLNLTATGTQAIGFLTAWPAGSPIPTTSSLNWPAAGTTVANASVVKLSPGGAIGLRSSSNATTGALAHHLIDVFGWFTS